MKRPSGPHSLKKVKKQRFPPGWDENRIKEGLEYYENQSEEEQLAEHEAAFQAEGQTVIVVPTELVPKIRGLIVQRRGA